MEWFIAGFVGLGAIGIVLALIERRRGKVFLQHDMRLSRMSRADREQSLIEGQIGTRTVGDPFKH